jgi:hypothetical protein
MSQPTHSFPTQNDQDIVIIGWDTGVPLNYPNSNSYPEAPPKRMRWVFLGPNPNPMEYGILQDLLENFDNNRYEGLILTAYWTSQLGRVHHLSNHRVNGFLEMRTLAPEFDLEISVRRTLRSGKRFVSSFLSIPVDGLGHRLTAVDVIKFQGLEVIHILPPSKELLGSQENLSACLRALTSTLVWASGLLKCVLPLDLFEYLEEEGLGIISQFNTIKELELTAPVNNDVPIHASEGLSTFKRL